MLRLVLGGTQAVGRNPEWFNHSPAGGLGPDNRYEWYFGDAWKVRRNFTLTAGLRYVRDTGRVDSNLGAQPVLNDWGAGLGNRVRTPGDNFAPQLGIAWDMTGKAKTVIRAGGGLFYENSIWNNVLFDSPARIPQGIFAFTPLVCAGGLANPFTWPTNVTPGSSLAGGAATNRLVVWANLSFIKRRRARLFAAFALSPGRSRLAQ